MRRLEAVDPFTHTWLAHQLRDDYWKHGSVCEDCSAINAAVATVYPELPGRWVGDPGPSAHFRLRR
ncbi:hypothetical protein [Streptomyces sp. E2N166]|uniref:hypothetical protein n=1 Tax=Streptomyces sp. E2N166 TaxID=1851909 RepID=UPI001EE9AEA7|nr:hypothetical protein [Streptomyces sp. E2N166]